MSTSFPSKPECVSTLLQWQGAELPVEGRPLH